MCASSSEEFDDVIGNSRGDAFVNLDGKCCTRVKFLLLEMLQVSTLLLLMLQV